MKDNLIQRLNILGKVTKCIVNIFKIVTMIVLVSTIVLACAVIRFPADTFELTTSHELNIQINLPEEYRNQQEIVVNNLDNLKVTINNLIYRMINVEDNEMHIQGTAITEEHTISIQKAGKVLLVGAIYPVVLLVLLYHIGILCDLLKNSDTPFSKDITDIIWKIAWLTIIAIGLFEVIQMLSEWIILGNLNVSINSLFVFGVVVLFMFVIRVFRYGMILQQESDETL